MSASTISLVDWRRAVNRAHEQPARFDPSGGRVNDPLVAGQAEGRDRSDQVKLWCGMIESKLEVELRWAAGG
jgi:hypothetical protein